MYRYKRIRLDREKTRDEHRIVLENMLGRKLLKSEVVHHKDGDRKNNSIENLEIMSLEEHSRMHMTGRHRSEETIDKMRIAATGRIPTTRKLSKEDVFAIKRKIADGHGIRSLAREFCIAHTTIMNIRDGKRYKNF